MSPTRDGCLSGTRVRQESGRPPLPRGQRACSRQPRPARGLGVAVRRSAGIAIRRAAAPLGIAHPPSRRSAPRVGVCVCVRVCMCAQGPPQNAGEGPGTPSSPLPSTAPSPTPLTRLGSLVPLGAPQCRLQLRLQLGFPLWLRLWLPLLLALPLRFPLGCCCARDLALASRGARRSSSAC